MAGHMNVRFYSPSYEFLGMADEATVIYTSRWHSYGQFEIHLPQNASYIQIGNRIIWNGDSKKNGIIEYIYVADDGSVTIKGYSLLWLLSQRITVPDSGSAYTVFPTWPTGWIMYFLVSKNATSCNDASRNFPNMENDTMKTIGSTLSYQTRYDNLLDCLTELSKYSMLGIAIDVSVNAGVETFKILQGTDHSLEQDTNTQVVFRRSYDNVSKETYTCNYSNLKNCAYVAGQGEGADRAISIVGNSYTGEARREILIDARDIEDASNLPSRGETKLADYVVEESFEISTIAEDYGSRWNLGDKVTIIGEDSGVTMHTYVTEVEETWDESGYEVIPTFGNPEKTLGQQASAKSTGSID